MKCRPTARGSSVETVRNDFSAFVGMASEAASTDSWNVKPWPEPVDTRVLLQEISAKISKYIIMHPEAVTATALWTMTAWAHEGATHSPILAAISSPIPARVPCLVFYAFSCRNRLSASNRLVPR